MGSDSLSHLGAKLDCMNQNRDVWASLAELASTRHGVFTRKQAADCGISNKRLRTAVQNARMHQPMSDVFAFASHPDSFRQRCAVASAAGAVISHTSAAALHRFDGYDKRERGPVEVCFTRNAKRAMPSGFKVHTWRRTHVNDIAVVDGIRCTSIARTLAQLGLDEPSERVERALDSALRDGASPRWIEKTLGRLRRPGPTGLQILESIIADPARSGRLSESVLEAVVERAIADPDLPSPVRQYELRLATGIRRLDLAFPEAKLGVEAHSRLFHWGAAKDEKDNLRDLELAAEGWEVVYITWGMAHEPALFIRLLKRTYRNRLKLLESQRKAS